MRCTTATEPVSACSTLPRLSILLARRLSDRDSSLANALTAGRRTNRIEPDGAALSMSAAPDGVQVTGDAVGGAIPVELSSGLALADADSFEPFADLSSMVADPDDESFFAFAGQSAFVVPHGTVYGGPHRCALVGADGSLLSQTDCVMPYFDSSYARWGVRQKDTSVLGKWLGIEAIDGAPSVRRWFSERYAKEQAGTIALDADVRLEPGWFTLEGGERKALFAYLEEVPVAPSITGTVVRAGWVEVGEPAGVSCDSNRDCDSAVCDGGACK
ncbi:MAG: hypothetical protein JW940_06250 [Polyangiaceae bacterium]|nr:hypothetical protein [Polyangiaceae bacterium]